MGFVGCERINSISLCKSVATLPHDPSVTLSSSFVKCKDEQICFSDVNRWFLRLNKTTFVLFSCLYNLNLEVFSEHIYNISCKSRFNV